MRQKYSAAVIVFTMCLSLVNAYSQGGAAVAMGSQVKSPLNREIERAYRLKEQKRSTEALAAFNGVLKKDPTNHAALTEAGYIHAGLKHYDAAVKYLAAASAQDPSNMQLHMDLGYVYQARNQRESAQTQFKIVAARPGEFQEKAQEALKVVAAGPAPASKEELRQRRLREQGYSALTAGNKAAARKAFQAAVANDPKDEAALKQLGFINLDEGALSAAAANFEAIRALEPSDYFVALQLGYTYQRLQKKEQAHEAFSAALGSSDAKVHDAAQAALEPAGAAIAPVLGTSL